MPPRNRSKQPKSLDQRLNDEALRLRERAKDTPPGPEHELLMQRIGEAEAAIQMNEWLKRPGAPAPLKV